MSGPEVEATVIPTGGAIRLDMPGYLTPPSGVTAYTLSRAVSGSSGLGSFTQLYSGAPQPVYLDVGDMLPQPLDMATGYVYQVADATGTTQIGPITPAPSLLYTEDPLTQILIRLIQAGVNGQQPPAGYGAAPYNTPPQVTTRMPQGGLAAMPFIVLNLDLIQQTQTGIGQDVPSVSPGNEWTIWVNAKRMWRISVMCANASARDYYRDLLLNVFQVIKPTVFAFIGLDVTSEIQAASGTDADEWEGKVPGFYYADIMLTLNGVLNTTILTGYGTFQGISASADLGAGPVPL